MEGRDREPLGKINYDLNYENSLIGALFIDPACIERMTGLSKEDFVNPYCAEIFGEAKRRIGNYLDPNEAAELIASKIGIEQAKQYIAECMMITPTASNAELYAKKIHEMAVDRELKKAIEDCSENYCGKELACKLITKCEETLRGNSKTVKSMADIMQAIFDELSEPLEGVIFTGFSKLDYLTEGFRKGEFIIIAGRPKTGKTILAQSIAENVAKSGKKVIYFILEMSDKETGKRWLSRCSQVPHKNILNHKLSQEEWALACTGAQNLSKINLYVCDEPYMSVDGIREILMETRDADLVVVDYLSLLQTSSKRERRDLEVSDMSRELKLLAKAMKTPIIALSQLNRIEDTKRPNLTNLRESGALEQDADKVIFIWNEDKEDGVKGIEVAANRNGATGSFEMKFCGNTMSFYDYETKREETGGKKQLPF